MNKTRSPKRPVPVPPDQGATKAHPVSLSPLDPEDAIRALLQTPQEVFKSEGAKNSSSIQTRKKGKRG